ncbi:hypothetical protein QCD60_00750 [Pokkaliibacter sp. MBI-7]|uniref:hypothetical protein n=1 Tax=Pokkaliibacter sp. MBI-7 TaxID=3040600 RepID=UPI0024476C6F|nr:hypothetical protein [Pokkaliibacter sp. MBI-7]MDH2431082.1 hypothetical protein [Pokkaliibacter sp. MBI-7]
MSAVLRRISLWWLGLVVALGGLCILLAQGSGGPLPWLAASGSEAGADALAEALQEAQPLPLDGYQSIWQHSLLSTSRSADQLVAALPDAPASEPPPVLNGFTLLGTLTNSQLRLAFVRDDNGNALTLRQGQTLPGGWQLSRVEASEVSLTLNGATQTLTFNRPHIPGLSGPSNESP